MQFAANMGYDVVAIARGRERERLAKHLGARAYIDSSVAPGEALQASGGAQLIVSTASTTAPVAELSTGLRPHGRLTLIGVDTGSVGDSTGARRRPARPSAHWPGARAGPR